MGSHGVGHGRSTLVEGASLCHRLDSVEQRHEIDDLVGQRAGPDRTAARVTETLQAVGVAAMPSFRATDLFADPHVVTRDLLTTVDGAERGGRLSVSVDASRPHR